MWIRSRWIDEQFIFARRDAEALTGWPGQVDSIRSIGSSQGELRLMRQEIPRLGIRANLPWGYERQINNWPKASQGASGEKKFNVVGVNLYELPPQLLKPPTAPAVQPARAQPPLIPPFPQAISGVKALAVRWWLITLATGIVPALWGWRALAWRRTTAKEGIRCPMCGYDMRATPDRCPECGSDVQNTKTILAE